MPLLRNLKRQKTGAAPELGRLAALEDYRGWHALVAVESVTDRDIPRLLRRIRSARAGCECDRLKSTSPIIFSLTPVEFQGLYR